MSKPSVWMHAPIGITELVSAICWTMYSGICTMSGRSSWLDWKYLSITSL